LREWQSRNAIELIPMDEAKPKQSINDSPARRLRAGGSPCAIDGTLGHIRAKSSGNLGSECVVSPWLGVLRQAADNDFIGNLTHATD